MEPFKARSTTEKVNDDICLSDEEDIVNSGFGEKTKRNQLIAMDDSGEKWRCPRHFLKSQGKFFSAISMYPFLHIFDT